MSFYTPSDSTFTRHYREELEMVFSAIDCVLHREHVIYCSSELTTGLRLYEALEAHDLKTVAELRAAEGEPWVRSKILDVNTESAIQFAECVRSRFADRTIVITPAPFSAHNWNQQEYLHFWEELLRSRIKAVWFNQNWAFSNGCTFEFAVTQDARLPAFDHRGEALDRSAGARLIRDAIERLRAAGFDVKKLEENLGYLLGRANE